MIVIKLTGQIARLKACQAVQEAPEGFQVRICEAVRNVDQNAKFHACCTDLARSGLAWAGKPRNAAEWKVLLVSGHSIATKQGAEMVPGLENEFVNLRESTARMSKARASSLIEYTIAFGTDKGVRWSASEIE